MSGTEPIGQRTSGADSVGDAQLVGVQTDKWTRWMIAIAVMVSAVMELVDTSAVNVSLPYIAGNLSASVDQATWVLTSHLIANAVVLPLSGWLANYFGRRRLLILSVAGFTLASIFCGLAPTLTTLVTFRILQGAAGGSLQPTSRAIMLEAFPREERGQAMALWGVALLSRLSSLRCLAAGLLRIIPGGGFSSLICRSASSDCFSCGIMSSTHHTFAAPG